MNKPQAPACAATVTVKLLALAAFCCIVATGPLPSSGSAPTTPALAGPGAGTTHITGEPK